MYIAGRKRTASSPSSTLILAALYSCGSFCPVLTPFAICLLRLLLFTARPGPPAASGLRFLRALPYRASAMKVALGSSDPHRHDHIPILLRRRVSYRPHLPRALLVFQLERDVVLRNRPQEVQQVLRIEPDLQVRALVFARNALFALAHLHRLRKNPDLPGRELNPDRPRPFVGELRHPLDRRTNVVLVQ